MPEFKISRDEFDKIKRYENKLLLIDNELQTISIKEISDKSYIKTSNKIRVDLKIHCYSSEYDGGSWVYYSDSKFSGYNELLNDPHEYLQVKGRNSFKTMENALHSKDYCIAKIEVLSKDWENIKMKEALKKIVNV